ncbi:STAS domain-containing protein [Actinomadura rupiterrae]|uniref:STAS domain-containing protein n=1 Tax=Actinomadura rupiterrae TaxID=559627 RepID=UPI0020A4C161|nr:STAS domain-containing protein [Actinomadura rupiterrae]MCP2334694.1 anti-anti-sigma factor [Actinomadura rupiterrae]
MDEYQAIVVRNPDHRVVALYGDLDASSMPALEAELFCQLTESDLPLVVSLDGVAFCDTGCLRSLLQAVRHADAVGCRLAFCCQLEDLLRVLRAGRLTQHMCIWPTVEEAVQAVLRP